MLKMVYTAVANIQPRINSLKTNVHTDIINLQVCFGF